MSVLKSIGEFLATGALLVVTYTLYFVTAVIVTVLLGLPIMIGIKMITDLIQTFFIGRF
jgi:hypothetical protein